MSLDLRANTAVDVLIGPFIDKTDGNTTEDGLTLTQAEIKLSKNGQALTQKTDITSAAFDDDGYYNCELDATDTNTEGQLVLIVHQSANALPVRHEFNVMAQAAWDSLYIAKDAGFMDVNIKTVGRVDTQETEANNLESACSNYSATRGLTGTAVPAVAADGVGGLPISDAGGLDLDAKLANTNEITAARMGVLTDWINAGRLDLILDIIAADTTTDIPALIATAQSDLNIITGTSGVVIQDNTITAAKLGADCITNAKIANNAFAVEQFADDFLTAAKIATGAIAADAVASTALDNIVMTDLAQGAPSATASFVTAMNYLYESWRNKTTTTATLITVMKDDGTTGLVKSTIDDNGSVFTKNEMTSGA